MQSGQDFLKDAWRRMANPKTTSVSKPALSKLRKTEWSKRFEHLMRNRLLVGYYRYGLLHTKNKPHDWISRAKMQLDKYVETGNTECLVDVANFMMTEFVQGHHPNKHFRAMDRAEDTSKDANF